VKDLTSFQPAPDDRTIRTVSRLPEYSLGTTSDCNRDCPGGTNQEGSEEGREEMATPFHTARIQVKGLSKETGHALVWIGVAISRVRRD